jgi:hypothetical protein
VAHLDADLSVARKGPLKEYEIEGVLFEGRPLLRPITATGGQDTADRVHTRLFINEMRSRYRGGGPEPQFLAASIAAVNAHPIITARSIREEITDQERRFRLPSTEQAMEQPRSPVEGFVALLSDRRGAYNWAGGSSQAFYNWITGPAPRQSRLSLDAQVNCWEALLAAAVEAGLVPVDELLIAYRRHPRDRAHALYQLLTGPAPPTELNHGPDRPGENDIKAGDFIMIDGVDGPMTHVVAAVLPDPKEYRNVRVISLWSQQRVGGGVLTQVKLRHVLGKRTTFRYASLGSSSISSSNSPARSGLPDRAPVGQHSGTSTQTTSTGDERKVPSKTWNKKWWQLPKKRHEKSEKKRERPKEE